MTNKTLKGILQYVTNIKDFDIAYKMVKSSHKINDSNIKCFQDKLIDLINKA